MKPSQYRALWRIRDGLPVFDEPATRPTTLALRRDLIDGLKAARWIAPGDGAPVLLPAGAAALAKEEARRRASTRKGKSAAVAARTLKVLAAAGHDAAAERWGVKKDSVYKRAWRARRRLREIGETHAQ